MVESSGSGRLIASERVDQLYMNCRMKLVEAWSNQLTKGVYILDVGAGSCYYSTYLSEAGFNVVALDMTKKVLVKCSRRCGFKGEKIVADASKLPFLSDSFDGVICIEVIEHVNEPDALLEEVSRILKVDSSFLLTTPNGDRPIRKMAQILGFDVRMSPFHKTEYGSLTLFRMFTEANFEICQVFCYALDLPTFILRLLPNRILSSIIQTNYITQKSLKKFLGIRARRQPFE